MLGSRDALDSADQQIFDRSGHKLDHPNRTYRWRRTAATGYLNCGRQLLRLLYQDNATRGSELLRSFKLVIIDMLAVLYPARHDDRHFPRLQRLNHCSCAAMTNNNCSIAHPLLVLGG